MEASRVDELVNRAIGEQVAEYRQWRDEAAALAARIERLEAAVETLRADVAAGVEAAARAGVAGEIDRLSDDVRRQISDLGRLIVNDLGRLPKLLAANGTEVVGPRTGELDLRDAPAAAHVHEERHLPTVGEARDPEVELPYAETNGDRRGLFRRR